MGTLIGWGPAYHMWLLRQQANLAAQKPPTEEEITKSLQSKEAITGSLARPGGDA